MAQKALEKIHWNYWAWNEQLSLEHKGHKARKRVHTHPRTHTLADWRAGTAGRQTQHTHIHTFPFIVTRRQKPTAQDIVESEWQIWNFIKFPFFPSLCWQRTTSYKWKAENVTVWKFKQLYWLLLVREIILGRLRLQNFMANSMTFAVKVSITLNGIKSDRSTWSMLADFKRKRSSWSRFLECRVSLV